LKKFIEKVDSNGVSYQALNPKWAEHIQKERYSYFLKESNIPSDYWDLDFNSFKWEKSLDSVNKCEAYAKNIRHPDFKNISLYLYGTNSSGKTTIACSIGKNLIKQGLNVQYVQSGDLIAFLLKTSGYSSDSDSISRLSKLNSADIVIIDDAFDKNKSIMWSKEDSKALIISAWDLYFRSALSNGVRFIISSNIEMGQFGLDYGKSLFELIDRNFVFLTFFDEIKIVRKKKQERVFDKHMS